jgi:hypothetical protein
LRSSIILLYVAIVAALHNNYDRGDMRSFSGLHGVALGRLPVQSQLPVVSKARDACKFRVPMWRNWQTR